MATSKIALISLLATITIGRWIALGFVISKHGEDKPTSQYNAIGHVFTSSIYCWILFELYNS